MVRRKEMNKKGQVWIETAIYTLIGLTIIAILLATALPQIEKIKDKGIVIQTVGALNDLDAKILEISQAPGNIRVIEFKIGKGKLEINPAEDLITYTLEDTNLELSETDVEIQEGNIILKTKEHGSKFNIILTMKYEDGFDFTYDGGGETKILQAGATPYKIQIENLGSDDVSAEAKTKINFNIL